ncbi:MAG: hypothetical protein ACQGVK_06200 [Myxococcota bacterium]
MTADPNIEGGPPLVLTAVGMTTALGPDAVSSCAAERAGLSRAAPLEDRFGWNPDEAEAVPLSGHCVRDRTAGFEGVGRLLRLGTAALDDLLTRAPELATDRGLGLVVAAPGGAYLRQAVLRQLSPDAAPGKEARDLAEAVVERHRGAVESGLVGGLVHGSGLAGVDHAQLVLGEGAAFAFALREAAAALHSGRVDRCLVGGVDSLVGNDALDSLVHLDLPKSPENPVGFLPGEAAAFLLLERAEASEKSALAQLGAAVAADGGDERFGEKPPDGRTLGRVVSAAASGPPPPDVLIGNLNGDIWHSQEWGTAVPGLPRELVDLPLWLPAVSFGEVGAATGAVGSCVAQHAFARGRGGVRSALVWSSGDDGAKGAVRWIRPDAEVGT